MKEIIRSVKSVLRLLTSSRDFRTQLESVSNGWQFTLPDSVTLNPLSRSQILFLAKVLADEKFRETLDAGLDALMDHSEFLDERISANETDQIGRYNYSTGKTDFSVPKISELLNGKLEAVLEEVVVHETIHSVIFPRIEVVVNLEPFRVEGRVRDETEVGNLRLTESGARFATGIGTVILFAKEFISHAPAMAYSSGGSGIVSVSVFNVLGERIARLEPYRDSLIRNANSAVGDFNGDGIPDVALAPEKSLPGGDSKVSIYFGASLKDGAGPDEHVSPFPGFPGSIRLSTADIDDDGKDDLVVGAGPGGGPHLKVCFRHDGQWDVPTGASEWSLYTWHANMTNGIYVAGLDRRRHGASRPLVVASAKPDGSPAMVRVFDDVHRPSASGSYENEFAAYAHAPSVSARVTGIRGSDGKAAVVTVAEGIDAGSHLRVFGADASGFGELQREFFAFDPAARGEFFIASGLFGERFEPGVVIGLRESLRAFDILSQKLILKTNE